MHVCIPVNDFRQLNFAQGKHVVSLCKLPSKGDLGELIKASRPAYCLQTLKDTLPHSLSWIKKIGQLLGIPKVI